MIILGVKLDGREEPGPALLTTQYKLLSIRREEGGSV